MLNSSHLDFPGNWDDAVFVGSNVYFRISNFNGAEESWSNGLELGIVNQQVQVGDLKNKIYRIMIKNKIYIVLMHKIIFFHFNIKKVTLVYQYTRKKA